MPTAMKNMITDTYLQLLERRNIDKITVKDAAGNDVTVTDNKFSMPPSNVTVTVTFKAKSTT